jgi:hypothetical protein
MAKKKNESADEIIDSLAKDVGATDEPKAKTGPKKPAADAHVETMSQMFMTAGGEMKEDAAILMERFVDPGARKRGATNLMVFVILIAAVGSGFYLLAKLSSSEAREERIAKKLAIEEAHMKEQLAKLKRFGNLRIETTPPGAVIIQDKDPAKCVKPNAATGQNEPCLTPLDISNLDMSADLRVRSRDAQPRALQLQGRRAPLDEAAGRRGLLVLHAGRPHSQRLRVLVHLRRQAQERGAVQG